MIILLLVFSVFVVTSDDMDWVRTRLLPRVGSAAVYPVGDGRQVGLLFLHSKMS